MLRQSVGRSAGRSVGWSVGWPVGRPVVGRPVGQRVCRSKKICKCKCKHVGYTCGIKDVWDPVADNLWSELIGRRNINRLINVYMYMASCIYTFGCIQSYSTCNCATLRPWEVEGKPIKQVTVFRRETPLRHKPLRSNGVTAVQEPLGNKPERTKQNNQNKQTKQIKQTTKTNKRLIV